MNTVTVTGWLQSDPMTEHVGDLAVCELRLAVERPGPDRRTERRERDVLRPARRHRRRAAHRRRPRRRDRLATHPARRHRRRQGSPAGRRRGRAPRLPRAPDRTEPWRPTRTSRPPTTTATSSTRCGDDRLLRPHRRHVRRPRLGRRRAVADGVARRLPRPPPHRRLGRPRRRRPGRQRPRPPPTAKAGSCPPTSSPPTSPATTVEHQVWVITDDLEDPDTATTILWPSDY